MPIFTSRGAPLAHAPPADLTIPQFILDHHHPIRPVRKDNTPWIIDDVTGTPMYHEEVVARVFGLANGIHNKWKLKEDEIVCIFSPNLVDYPIAVWATHRLGAIVSTANPSYTAPELAHQLTVAKPSLLFTIAAALPIALEAARTVGLPEDRIVLLTTPVPLSVPAPGHLTRADDLIKFGLECPTQFVERRLNKDEAKTKIALLAFSSGTTGKPKAVAIPHYSVTSNVLQAATFNRVNDDTVPNDLRRYIPGDVSLGVLPLFHIYGMIINLHFTLFCAMSIVITPKFAFEEMLKSIVRYRITHLYLVPPQLVLICKHSATKKYDLSHVRFVMVGAAPVSPELQNLGMTVLKNACLIQGYGMTETATLLTMGTIEQRKGGVLGSAGQLVSGTEAKVIKEDGSLADYGEEGEFAVRGPQMALRYEHNEAATKETFRDGWVHTGDKVIVREDGEIFIVDRLKEFLKVRGFQVAPAELEGHLLGHPDVNDVGVVGIQDEFSGELPVAYVALQPHALKRIADDPKEAKRVKEDLKKARERSFGLLFFKGGALFVSDSKVRYKWLEGGVEFIDAIPKNPSGKILRRVLRERVKKLVEERKSRATPAKL
ncbi:hypothetical protein BOTBODRAFT_40152 [Botryobasidium botryosum FD-172 SS1]|uniref:AMP-dependent synthetase/ligase domain-containing protein n=1 Tax=Botryobasidium botryosum (strain FD-172 SS1) TaxID=930990 RepID=A0A067NC54_BOTB1|nr:hypothetical protein BOTBODRAFT_40152 [Botryobasidium botryosum FD-172 SS1]